MLIESITSSVSYKCCLATMSQEAEHFEQFACCRLVEKFTTPFYFARLPSSSSMLDTVFVHPQLALYLILRSITKIIIYSFFPPVCTVGQLRHHLKTLLHEFSDLRAHQWYY